MGIESKHPQLSIRRQCDLFGLNRSSFYYDPIPIGEEDLRLMREIDEIYTRLPFYGVPRITKELKKRGFPVGKKRVRRLMREMNIQAIYPKPNLSRPRKENPVYPYLLKDLMITAPNQVWCTDITYIRMRRGFVYLVAIMDWYSRFVLSWEISITLDVDFCLRALESAFRHGLPSIFNSDQGSQFTSLSFTGLLEEKEILISMDGKGRVYDNIFIERLWRSLKYEEVYLRDYQDINEVKEGLGNYFDLYNFERLHQSLDYNTPASVYYERREVRSTA